MSAREVIKLFWAHKASRFKASLSKHITIAKRDTVVRTDLMVFSIIPDSWGSHSYINSSPCDLLLSNKLWQQWWDAPHSPPPTPIIMLHRLCLAGALSGESLSPHCWLWRSKLPCIPRALRNGFCQQPQEVCKWVLLQLSLWWEPSPGQHLDYTQPGKSKQRTQLSCDWTLEPQKLWNSNCVFLYSSKFVIFSFQLHLVVCLCTLKAQCFLWLT